MDKLLIKQIMTKLSFYVLQFSKKIESIALKIKVKNYINNDTKDILKRNAIFENKHKNKRAFVIVNGPSLTNQNIQILKDDITFVVSGFFKHKVIDTWQPTYYSILDKSFFDNSNDSLLFFKQLNEKIKESIFFIPLFRGYKSNIKNNLLPKDKTFYIASSGLPDDNIDLTKIVQSFQSVSSFALAQAIYMGCNPIYLLGFDHDYLANQGPDKHFYQGATIPNKESTYKTAISKMYPYDDIMATCHKLWQNYRHLNVAANKRGIKIYNATKGGYLDVFERIEYESIHK
jgi:hypothetical protein